MARFPIARLTLTLGCLTVAGLTWVFAAAPPGGKPTDAYHPVADLPPLPPLLPPQGPGPTGDHDPTQAYARQALQAEVAAPRLEPAPFLRQGIPDPAELAGQVRLSPAPADDDPPESSGLLPPKPPLLTKP